MVSQGHSQPIGFDRADLLVQEIIAGMARSADRWRTRPKISRDDLPEPEPERWQAELDRLIASGIDEIVIGYLRVSGEEQADKQGPEVQRQGIAGWAGLHAPRRQVDLWVWDVETGKNGGRVGYNFVQRASTTKCVAYVVVNAFDRFSREGAGGEVVIERLRKEFGTRVVSVSQAMEDNEPGSLLRLILLGFAKYEAHLISQRTSSGKRAKVRQEGSFQGGRAPYGYRVGNHKQPGSGKMWIDDDEARLVRLVYDLYARGYTCLAIANGFNRLGIKPRMGKQWGPRQISLIIQNEPKYRAEATWGNMPSEVERPPHPAILEHRECQSDRSYLISSERPKLPIGTRVPDDLLGNPLPPEPHKVRTRLSLEQAQLCVTCYDLHDSGETRYSKIAERLNELNMKSMLGDVISRNTVRGLMIQRRLYEPHCSEMGVKPVTTPVSAEENLRFRMAKALELAQSVRADGLSFRRIAECLNDAGYRTTRGGMFDAYSAEDLIKGKGGFSRAHEELDRMRARPQED